MEFKQVSDAQFQWVLQEIGKNTQNLYKIGDSMKDSKQHRDSIERKVEDNITSIKTESGFNKSQVENIIEDFYGDDIELLHSNTTNLGVALQAAKIQRDAIDAKTISNKNEHIDFHNKFTTIGNDMTDLGIALDGKASKDHTHEGTGEDCGWFGEKCFLKNLFPSVPSTAILAVVGIGAFVLLKDKI